MVTLPIGELTCFYIAMLAFIVVGFQRGWKRELITLVFVLLGAFFIQPTSTTGFSSFLGRLTAGVGFIFTGKAQTSTTTPSFLPGLFGSWGPLIIFAAVVALGYFVGSKAFPRPSTPSERFIGIVPAIVYGAVILSYLGSYLRASGGNSNVVSINLTSPDPSNYVPIIFVIAIVAVIVGMLVSRTKKAAGPPAKK
jgi:hypothetical protein